MMNNIGSLRILGYVWLFLVAVSCEKETATPASIDLLSIKINGATLTTGATDIPVSSTIQLVFSASLQKNLFESALSITAGNQEVAKQLSYTNQSSQVSILLSLDYQTTYTLTLSRAALTEDGAGLSSELSYQFTTAADGTIYRLPPCGSASADCLENITVENNPETKVALYSSFPLDETAAEWQDLKTAIIVVHGASRNADDYFNYLGGSLREAGLEKEVLLLAPYFRQEGEAAAGELFWSGNDWREGQNSVSSQKISSFAVIDELIDQLSDQQRYPVLERIVITGHSSGALFTHLYAASGKTSQQHPEFTYHYLVANSQYFYYPDGQRIDETTNELYTPTGCTGYDFWPLGFSVLPPYLNAVQSDAYNERFMASSITYLLGNGTGNDSALNTVDCSATLLGASRYERGENLFRYMELRFPNEHQHKKIIVEGIGHNGAGMYSSPEFEDLLLDLVQ